jgi:membrane protease subunit (stomatin/prohibitin family)
MSFLDEFKEGGGGMMGAGMGGMPMGPPKQHNVTFYFRVRSAAQTTGAAKPATQQQQQPQQPAPQTPNTTEGTWNEM